MPTLRCRTIFISHAWSYDAHYLTLCQWLNEEPNFLWHNYSVPRTDGLADKTVRGLKEGITRQMRPAQAIVILGGMYAAHSGWIAYEIEEAQRMEKVVIGVRPWGQERVPSIVQQSSICEPVGWNRASVVNAIRLYS